MNELDEKIKEELKNTEEGELLSRPTNLGEEVVGIFRGKTSFLLGMDF